MPNSKQPLPNLPTKSPTSTGLLKISLLSLAILDYHFLLTQRPALTAYLAGFMGTLAFLPLCVLIPILAKSVQELRTSRAIKYSTIGVLLILCVMMYRDFSNSIRNISDDARRSVLLFINSGDSSELGDFKASKSLNSNNCHIEKITGLQVWTRLDVEIMCANPADKATLTLYMRRQQISATWLH